MSWLFGKDKKKAPTVSATEHQEKIAKMIDDANRKEEYLTKKIADAKKKAIAYNKQGNKKMALQCMKRMKQFEAEQIKTSQRIDNLYTQQGQIASAVEDIQHLHMIQDTTKVVKSELNGIDADKVDDIMDDYQDMTETMNEISSAVTRPLGEQYDEDELLGELDELEGLDENEAGLDAPVQDNPQAAAADDDEEALSGLMAGL